MDYVGFIHLYVADSHGCVLQFFALNQIESLSVRREDVLLHASKSLFPAISFNIFQVNMSGREVVGIGRISNDAAKKRRLHKPDLISHRALPFPPSWCLRSSPP